jgi:hypothetical protein
MSRGGSPVAPGNGSVPLPVSGAPNDGIEIKAARKEDATSEDTKDFMSFSY